MYSSFAIILLSVVSISSGFSSLGRFQHQRNDIVFAFTTNSLSSTAFHSFPASTTLFSTPPPSDSNSNEQQVGEEVEPKVPTPITDGLQKQSESFTSEPQPQQRLDPLLASLTRMDEEMMNTPTTKVPLLGEIPLDGSIVVLLPVALIAVVGFVMSINIAFNSKDIIVQKMDEANLSGKMYEINAAMSNPPVKQSVEYDGCRGLCNNQDEQLDNMRNFMNSLAPKK